MFGQIPGPGVVYFNGNPLCAERFGAEILGGEQSQGRQQAQGAA